MIEVLAYLVVALWLVRFALGLWTGFCLGVSLEIIAFAAAYKRVRS